MTPNLHAQHVLRNIDCAPTCARFSEPPAFAAARAVSTVEFLHELSG